MALDLTALFGGASDDELPPAEPPPPPLVLALPPLVLALPAPAALGVAAAGGDGPQKLKRHGVKAEDTKTNKRIRGLYATISRLKGDRCAADRLQGAEVEATLCRLRGVAHMKGAILMLHIDTGPIYGYISIQVPYAIHLLICIYMYQYDIYYWAHLLIDGCAPAAPRETSRLHEVGEFASHARHASGRHRQAQAGCRMA